jgi:hypothetical protein
MSVEAARRLGVPEENWIYVHGHADMVEQAMLDRAGAESQISYISLLLTLRSSDGWLIADLDAPKKQSHTQQ